MFPDYLFLMTMIVYIKAKHTNLQKSYVFADPMYIFSENGSKTVTFLLKYLLYIATKLRFQWKQTFKVSKYNPVDSLYGCCYLSTATHSEWNQHVKQMMMILYENCLWRSLYKYTSLQNQTETIKIGY